jgi:tetratricopeptide (TPR) repeat protein
MDYIFGYGSIINDESRCGTLYESSTTEPIQKNLSRNKLTSTSPFGGGSLPGDEAVAVSVSSLFAKRCWNFRCPTGFTALGFVLQNPSIGRAFESQGSSGLNDINGVIFPVTTPQQLRSFDLREVGYNRVCIPLNYLTIETSLGCDAAQSRAKNLQEKISLFQQISSKQNQSFNADVSMVTDNFQGIGRMFSEDEDFYFDDTSTDSPSHPSITTDPTSTIATTIVDPIRIWVYVPDQTYAALPNEDHPILQTYLDICIRGCLQWGGPSLAKRFVQSTMDWSECFLNDAPLSRRPWIYRKDYSLIDQCLSDCAELVKFASRKHPEEYASLHQTAFKPGQWGLSNRNPLFTGREESLRLLHKKLTLYDNNTATASGASGTLKQQQISLCSSSSSNCLPSSASASASSASTSPYFSINEVQLIGHGGVGKSQLTMEYAHRYLKTFYNFIAFIRAESFATISSDLRKLAMDLNIMSQHKKKTIHPTNLDSASPLKHSSRSHLSLGETGEAREIEVASESVSLADELATMDDETIGEEIRKRLTRCRFKWLLIFDNVDDPSVLSLCVPRGVEGVGCGHIIVTSRISHPDWSTRGTILNLNCFDEKESVTYLQSALSNTFVEEDRCSAHGEEEKKKLIGSEASSSSASRENILDKLATSLGHLPLALTIASNYMTHCDVHPREYLKRLDASMNQTEFGSIPGVMNGQDALMSCFGLTLDRIELENPSAVSVLPCLGFLAPDVSKEIVHFLLCCGHFKMIGPQEVIVPTPPTPCQSLQTYCAPATESLPSTRIHLSFLSSIAAPLIGTLIVCHLFFPSPFTLSPSELRILLVGLVDGILICLVALMFGLFISLPDDASLLGRFSQLTLQLSFIPSPLPPPVKTIQTDPDRPNTPEPVTLKLDDEAVMAQTDQLWHSLRQFSLLSLVRENATDENTNPQLPHSLFGSNRIGTIHRLQQSVLRVRVSRSLPMKLLCFERCVWLLATLWKFTPHDISTWKSSGDLIEHIQILTRHLADLYQRTPSADLTLSAASLLTLSKLLTDASQYTAIVLSKHDDSEQLLHLSLIVITFLRGTLNTTSPSSSCREDPHELTQETLLTHSYTLHMLGKVCRYNGKLVESEKYLKRSLEMNKTLLSLGKRSTELCQSMRDELRGVLQNLALVDVIRETHDNDFTELLSGLDQLLLFAKAEREKKFTDSLQSTGARPGGGSLCQIQSRLSDTLHELGVLFLRTHHLPLSKSYLLSSLKIQSNPLCLHASSSDLFSLCLNKASSLYQLGVIHTIEQRYPLAKVFLDYSLRLMQDMHQLSPPPLSSGTSLEHLSSSRIDSTTAGLPPTYPLGVSVMSKAAIFQQLGKIEYRKGNLPEAKEFMFRALNIYQEIYGPSTGDAATITSSGNNTRPNYPTKSNINIACIHHQLGTIYTALHDYASACEHLVQSLQIREMMLLEYKSGHILDYVISLQAIGKAEVEHRGADVALTYLLRAKQLIEDELREMGEGSGGGRGGGGGETGVMTYRCSSSTTAFVGIIDIGDEVDTEDIIPPPHPPLTTTLGRSSTPPSPSSSISSSYCEMLSRQLESCLHSLKRITKLKRDYSQFQLYDKELKDLKKRKELSTLTSTSTTAAETNKNQPAHPITLPPNTTLKVDEATERTSGRSVLEWDGRLVRSLEQVLMVRSEVRLMCLQTLKVLKQLPLDAPHSVIESAISHCLPSREDFLPEEQRLRDERDKETERDAEGEGEEEESIQKVGEIFLSQVRGLLSERSGSWISVDEVRRRLNSLLGHCDALRSQLKERGLVLEDKP